MAAAQKQSTFLTADWRNVVMLNYVVDPALLHPHVPAGTQLDLYDGKALLSLVGFEFMRSRLLGIKVPFHQSFEEVNLRCYVKRSSKRGVVFLRELVPKLAVACLARTAFGENYSCVPMSHRIESRADGQLAAEYRWGRGADACSMQVETEPESFLPPDGSEIQFIAEHYWGYAAQKGGGCIEYEVQHPPWRVRRATRASFSGDAARFYGAGVGQILSRQPYSAFLAEGSAVTVMKGTRIN